MSYAKRSQHLNQRVALPSLRRLVTDRRRGLSFRSRVRPALALFLLLFLPMGLLSASSLAAELRAFVDPSSIDETETLRLTLRLEGSNNADAPDLTALERDFEVLGSSNSSQYRSINGQVRSWFEVQISLRPRSAGQLVVPSLELGGERSAPVTVDVRALDPSLKRSIDEMVFFETEVTPNPVYVQAELKVIRRLFYSTTGGVQMYSDLPGVPEIADAVVVALGDTNSFAAQRNGREYGVVEQRFAVYPESSGTLTIPEVALTTSVRVMKNGRLRRSGVRVRSEAVSVEVLPIPASYPADAPWLPATSLQLSQTLTPSTNLPTGATAELTLRADVTGNVASAIAPMTLAVPESQFRQYPKAPSTSDEVLGASLVGSRVQRTSLVALKPGQAVIPGAEVVWWNTLANRVERARAQALALTLTGSNLATPASGGAAADGNPSTTNPLQNDSLPGITSSAPPPLLGKILTALALIAGAGIGWALWQQRGDRAAVSNRRPASDSARAAAAQKRLTALLTTAATADGQAAADPATASTVRRGLLQAISFARRCSNADAVALLSATAEHRGVLEQLDNLAYGSREGQATPSAPTVSAVLAAYAAVAEAPGRSGRAAARKRALPPLYPTGP